MCSEVYTRSCSLHAYSTWSCIDWLLGDSVAASGPTIWTSTD